MWKYLGKEPQPSKSNYAFKMQYSFEKRLNESEKVLQKFPNSVPIIVEKSDHSVLPELKKRNFLMNKEVQVGQFIHLLRTNIQLDPSQAIFLFVNNSSIPSISEKLGNVYEKYHDKDGFLYITYAAENTFG